MKVCAYVRVSSEEQAVEGISLAAQEAKLRAYAAMRGFDVVEVVSDPGVSGSIAIGKRPGGKRVVELVRAKEVGAVLAWKLDRLFRDCSDCLTVTRQWDNSDVALHLVDLGGAAVDTKSAIGRFFLTVMAGAAELERNQGSERTRAALQHLKATGKRAGTVPLGMLALDDNTLVANPRTAQAARRAQTLRLDGLGYGTIAKALNIEGFRSQAGGEFTPSTVKRYLAWTVAA